MSLKQISLEDPRFLIVCACLTAFFAALFWVIYTGSLAREYLIRYIGQVRKVREAVKLGHYDQANASWTKYSASIKWDDRHHPDFRNRILSDFDAYLDQWYVAYESLSRGKFSHFELMAWYQHLKTRKHSRLRIFKEGPGPGLTLDEYIEMLQKELGVTVL